MRTVYMYVHYQFHIIDGGGKTSPPPTLTPSPSLPNLGLLLYTVASPSRDTTHPQTNKMSDQTPRVNAPLLSRFVDRTVRIIGKVTELHGDKAVIDASGPITLALQRVRILTG